MRIGKNHPIDLNSEYPCPCRRQGKLLPIILTEAMGCDRCQQIFVVKEEEGYIEQLNSSYPYKKRWRWNGRRWLSTQKLWQENYFALSVMGFIFSMIISIPLWIIINKGINLISVIIFSLILITISFSLWLVISRR